MPTRLKKQVSLLNTSLESEEKNKRLAEEKLKEQIIKSLAQFY